MLDVTKNYIRIDNVIYEIEINMPVIKLFQVFPNHIFNKNSIEYMNRYMEMFPDLWQDLKSLQQKQLSLF